MWAVGLRVPLPHWPLARFPCHMGLSIEKLIIWQLASSKQASKKRRRLRQRERKGERARAKQEQDRD